MPSVRASGFIDRQPQNLPVPLGGAAPIRLQRQPPRRTMRAHALALMIGAGFTCAAVGLILLAVPPSVAVYLRGDHLVVGDMVLAEVGAIRGTQTTAYAGDASYVLVEYGDGSATAAASWASSGRTSSGVCNLRPMAGRLIDECRFIGAAGPLTSVDVLDPATGPEWQRTYGDGVQVTILVSPDGSAVPVPFSIGH